MENKRQNQQTKIYFNITFINEFYFKIYLIKKKKKKKEYEIIWKFCLKIQLFLPCKLLIHMNDTEWTYTEKWRRRAKRTKKRNLVWSRWSRLSKEKMKEENR